MAPQPPVQGSSTFWPVLGALIAFGLIVLLGLAAYNEQQRQQEVEREFDRLACEEYSYCD